MFRSSYIRRKYLAKGKQCLEDEQVWNELVEDVLKKLEGIEPVTREHLEVMKQVRLFYLDKQRAPTVKEICSINDISLSEFFPLFPDWPHTMFNIDCIVYSVTGFSFWNSMD